MAWAVKRGTRWQGRYYDNEGRTRAAGTWDRKSDAIAAAQQKETPHAVKTWGDWKPSWIKHRQVQPGTAKVDNPRIDLHLARWEDWALTGITRQAVTEWITGMQDDGMSAGTIKKLVGYLSSSMQAALQADLIATNPCRGVKLPKSDPSPDRYLSDTELDKLRDHLAGTWLLMFELLLGTGMRTGEALGLHWEDVNLDQKTVRVRWSWDRNMRNMKPPKSHQDRTLPLGDTLVELLRSRANQGAGTPPSVEYRGSYTPHTGTVVGTLNDTEWRYTWRATIRAAGIGNIRVHDLRHTYASRLAQKGAPMGAIQRLLGHESITTTERYARLAPDYHAQVRGLLE